MIRWLLDTDHLSLQERGHAVLRRRLAAVPPETVATSAVTLQEMLRGRLAVLSRDLPGELRAQAYQKLVDTVRFFNTIPFVPFDVACEEKFQELRRHRIRIGTLDLRIAAVALVHDLTVISRNWKDFGRVPGLKLADWTKAD
ncbi:MAG: type II toxin-antitoxin system VapC family toxin [bacterium]|nr:type II toxin-antitoxin system VapC family toxin [bacterium]